MHVSEHYLSLIEALNEDPTDLPLVKKPVSALKTEIPEFHARDEEKNKVSTLLLDEANIDSDDPIILLNPSCSDLIPIRKWDEEKFIELAKRLLDDVPDCKIVFTGSPSERPKVLEIVEKIGFKNRVYCAAGRTTLRELIVLYTLCDILVTNDSGPGLFASMTSIQTIVLFGPETPSNFGIHWKRNVHIVWKNLVCSPCVNVFNHRFTPCKNSVCMQSITVDEIFALTKKCLIESKNRIKIVQ